MTVPKQMMDMNYIYAEVPVLVGSPPQTVSMTVNLAGELTRCMVHRLRFLSWLHTFRPSAVFYPQSKLLARIWLERNAIPC
jgi:hypothetical protein